MMDPRYLELLDDDRKYIKEHWEEIANFHSSILQPVDLEQVYLKSVFSWIGSSLEGDIDGISTQVLEYYANNSNEVVLATYDHHHAVVTLDLTNGQVSSASFEKNLAGTVERVAHFVNHTLEQFYQSSNLFDHYRALILEQPNKKAYLYQLMKALMALDKQLIINNDPNNAQFWNLECLALYEQYVLEAKVPVLSREEEITKILERAGWFAGRQTDISEFEQYCREQKLGLFPAALDFLREFNGLTLSYATYYHSGYDISRRSNYLYDYINASDPSKRKYMLVPTLDLTHPHISEFNRILIFSEESCVAVGEFGYYHSLLTIGQSGTFYLAHEFSEEIEVFDSLTAVLAWDMEQTKVVTDSLILNNDEKIRRLNQMQNTVFAYACLDLLDVLLKQAAGEAYHAELADILHALRRGEAAELQCHLEREDTYENEKLQESLRILRELFTAETYTKASLDLYEQLLQWHQHYGEQCQKLFEEIIHAFLVAILYQNGYRSQKSLQEGVKRYAQKLGKLAL